MINCSLELLWASSQALKMLPAFLKTWNFKSNCEDEADLIKRLLLAVRAVKSGPTNFRKIDFVTLFSIAFSRLLVTCSEAAQRNIFLCRQTTSYEAYRKASIPIIVRQHRARNNFVSTLNFCLIKSIASSFFHLLFSRLIRCSQENFSNALSVWWEKDLWVSL